MTLHNSPGQAQPESQPGAVAAGQVPGRGGVSRGRADAPMFWGDESPEQAGRFEATLLPRELEGLDNSLLLGVGASTPEAGGQGEAAGLTEVEASAGSSATRRRLSPRHRRAVGTFFGDPKKPR